MSRFSIRNPYLIIVLCLVLLVVGVTAAFRMPVDLFPRINMPEVVVATFYNGMPPRDVEVSITDPLERFFTLASGVDHMESRSLLGVSIIKVYFQPSTNANADVTQLSNLALADLKRLPPGTLPPVVLNFDASSLPVCLVTIKGKGLTETQLHDTAQFQIRNQIAVVKGAEVPPPFGGKYRQVMVYVDPYKLQSRQLSVMDVVKAINRSNLILPAGDVKIGPNDYFVYSNSLIKNVKNINNIPVKTVGDKTVTVGDIGKAEDSSELQYNIVRIDGQKSTYIPIMKQGGDTNTIQVVSQVRHLIHHLIDIPKQMKVHVAFDQSRFVKEALKTVVHEGLVGLALTSIMILIFLGSIRATSAVLLSIPLSALATFIVLYMWGSTINTMVLGGLALAFSRVIDNSVISLENIYRHLEMGSSPPVAAEQGGAEVNNAVLAGTLVDVVDFFPVTMLYGVGKFLFSALALAFCLSLAASYVIAMTVIPLFCSRFLKSVPPHLASTEQLKDGSQEQLPHGVTVRLKAWFERAFEHLLKFYEKWVRRALRRPALTVGMLLALFGMSFSAVPLVGMSFFPETDAGQFTISVKVPTGTRIELTNQYVANIENMIRHTVTPHDLKMIVSNIGVNDDFSALYSSNAGEYMATIQVALHQDHKIGSYVYMRRIQKKMATEFPQVRSFFSSGSMVDAILNSGMPAPIDVQVTGDRLNNTYNAAQVLARKISKLHDAGQVYVPQDMDYPALRLVINRVHAAELGLTQKEVVDNVITALNSNAMIAPNYWVDYKTGNDYFLTVQYYKHGAAAIHNMIDLKEIPLRAPNLKEPTTLDTVVSLERVTSPSEIDHYQIQRVDDVYVSPKGQDLERLTSAIQRVIKKADLGSNVRVHLGGMVQGMNASFRSFAIGFGLSFVLLLLILVAQFRSFVDPFLVMLAIPMAFVGVLIILPLTHTTLNVMSLMGVLMLVGIANSNSILIVDFAHRLQEQGLSVMDAVVTACRVRLRPILMTTLATIIGMIPMALNLGAGGEQYTPMARTIIGGLTSSVLLTIFIVPAAYLLIYGRKKHTTVAQ